MKFLTYLFAAIVLLSILVWLGVKDTLNPIKREQVDSPVFTIGNLAYQQALEEDKQIVKFGKMFWGLYPGGLAFKSPVEAMAFVKENQYILDKFSSGWAIYELSGDLVKDTYSLDDQYYLKNSMLVIRQVAKP